MVHKFWFWFRINSNVFGYKNFWILWFYKLCDKFGCHLIIDCFDLKTIIFELEVVLSTQSYMLNLCGINIWVWFEDYFNPCHSFKVVKLRRNILLVCKGFVHIIDQVKAVHNYDYSTRIETLLVEMLWICDYVDLRRCIKVSRLLWGVFEWNIRVCIGR